MESVENRQFVRVASVIRKVLGVGEDEELMSFIRRMNDGDWKGKSQKAFDYTTNNVLDVVGKSDDISEEQFVLELAKAVTGFELSYWTDNKINDFEETFREVVNKLNDYDPEKGLKEGEIKITIESSEGTPVTTQFSNEELSVTGKMMLNKMKNTLTDFGESISYEEKISIITEIIKDVIG